MSYDTLLEPLWAFVRRDLRPRPFREWLRQAAALEDLLGAAIYLDLRALNFDDPHAVAEQRTQLRDHLLQYHPPQCDCPLIGSRERLPIGTVSSELGGFAVLRRRTPWLELLRCRTCGTLWHLATDTFGDDFHFLRLDEDSAAAIIAANQWPADFDDRPVFWPQPEWLADHGYADLAAWQRQHGFPDA